METLHVLEEKIASLVKLVQDLKDQNAYLSAECDSLNNRIQSLSTQNVTLETEKTTLAKKLHSVESNVVDGTEQIAQLSSERALTRSVVDELIKSIDKLVAQEK